MAGRFILNEERRVVLREMFDLTYKDTVIEIRKSFKTIIPIVEFQSIRASFFLFYFYCIPGAPTAHAEGRCADLKRRHPVYRAMTI